MTAERDPMTLNESSAPALGVEERSDEAPRAGRARPTPDPEVVAKPTRRQFTAQYRLRILEEAERCTQPGDGSAASPRGVVQLPSDGLAQGAAQGFASGVGPEEARRKAGERNPRCEGAESGSPGARAHTAHTIFVQGSRAAGIEPRTRNALLMAAQPLLQCRSAWRIRRAKRWGSRATFYRRQRPTPGHQQPRPTPARALCESEREHILAPAHASSTVRRRRSWRCSTKASRVLGADDGWPRRRSESGAINVTIPSTPSPTSRHGANQTWSWDRLGPRSARTTSSGDAMVADRENFRSSHRADLRGRSAPGAHALRAADDEQVHRTTARRTRSLSRCRDDKVGAQFKTLKYHPGFPGRFHDLIRLHANPSMPRRDRAHPRGSEHAWEQSERPFMDPSRPRGPTTRPSISTHPRCGR